MDFRKRKVRDDPEINLIPFIDVLLVILIFLMVTTTYSKYTELQVTLPVAHADMMPERPNELYIAIDAAGNYAINNHRIVYENPAQLAREMRIAAPEGKDARDPIVVIAADGSAPHQRVVNVMEAARLAGLERLTFATQSEAGG
ncbi:MAG: biopolymer transporter ExbD [Burkholderiaceae bacterium]|jgi:biopolymer transport protein ExbD|nr:biopolymer transporter ExbD [Burkholderiaceae bacterium]